MDNVHGWIRYATGWLIIVCVVFLNKQCPSWSAFDDEKLWSSQTLEESDEPQRHKKYGQKMRTFWKQSGQKKKRESFGQKQQHKKEAKTETENE